MKTKNTVPTRKEHPDEVALVITAVPGRVSKLLVRVCKQAERLLTEANYDVRPYLDGDSTEVMIYAEIMGFRADDINVRTAFVAAHGSPGGLHNQHGEILLGPQTCRLMTKAVLILVSCLHDGEFPTACLQHKDGPAACIGFEGSHYALIPTFLAKLLDAVSGQHILRRYEECLLEPLRLLVGGSSTGVSTERAKSRWGDNARRLRSENTRAAFLFQLNHLGLRYWGDGAAKL